MIRPKFKESVCVEVLEPDTVFLVSENNYHLLTSPVYKHLAPLLHGEHTIPEIAGLLADKIPVRHVMAALKKLEASGHIVEADNSLPSEQAAFWHLLNVDVPTAVTQLQQKQVAVTAVGEASAQPIVNALQSFQVEVTGEADFLVVVTDDYLQEDLAAINQNALSTNQAWMLAKVVGETIWIGPIFQPYETACWHCLAHRVRSNRPVEAFVLRKRVDKSSPFQRTRPTLEVTVQMGANMLATEVAKWIGQGHVERLHNQLVVLNTLTMEMQTHFVVRRPQCPVCGTPEAFRSDREPELVVLHSCEKRFTWDGGHRTLLPEEAFERYKHHISPITGVITHLHNTLPESEGLIHCYIAGHDFLTTDKVKVLSRNVQGRSSGKGMTKTQAKMSAMGEAMERYSGVYRGEGEIIVRGTFKALAPQAVHPNDVWRVSEKQYENRLQWNRKQKSTYHIIYKPFDESAEIDWTPFWSLTNQEFKYYPAFCAYYGHPDFSLGFGSSNSNGCAAGHTLEEAIFQAFLELVERDSVAIWWYNRIKRPRVDLATFGVPYVQELQAYYEGLNRSFWVLDITADFNIPTFVAVSGRLHEEVENIVIGLGTHLDPRIALLRSLSELNQLLANVFYNNPDGTTQYAPGVEETIEWFKTAKMENHDYLVPSETLPAKKFTEYPVMHSNDLRQDIESCVRLAQDAGLETLVLDQSRPDVGMKVCRVIVPGLRHFWRWLGPGRLYDVPVKLGWLDEPLAEDALNPVSMFF